MNGDGIEWGVEIAQDQCIPRLINVEASAKSFAVAGRLKVTMSKAKLKD